MTEHLKGVQEPIANLILDQIFRLILVMTERGFWFAGLLQELMVNVSSNRILIFTEDNRLLIVKL